MLKTVNYKEYFIIFVFVLLGLSLIPARIAFASLGLDSSYVIGTYLTVENGWQFGKDIVWTFGPFHKYESGIYFEYSQWLGFFVISCILPLGIFIISLLRFILKTKPGIIWSVVLAYVIFHISNHMLGLYLVIGVLLTFYLVLTEEDDESKWVFWTVVGAALLGIHSLIKFTNLILSMGIILAFVLLLKYKNVNSQLKLAGTVVLAYIASFLMGWLFTGQSISNLPAYFFSGYHIVSGFSTAMSYPGPLKEVILAVIFLISLLILPLISAALNLKNLATLSFLSSPLVFVTYKAGIVRHDASHISSLWPLAAILLLIVLLVTLKHEKKNLIMIIFIALPALGYNWIALNMYREYPQMQKALFTKKVSRLRKVWESVKNPQALEQGKTSGKDKGKRVLSFSKKDIEQIGQKSVDIFTYESSIAYIYDLNWKPRPVFQSYQCYTDYLDQINAAHFRPPNAPDFLIYDYKNLINGVSIFLEPETHRNILKLYKFEKKLNDEFALFGKRPSPLKYTRERIKTEEYEANQRILIPEYKPGFVSAEIYITPSLLGNLKNLVYKISKVDIEIKTRAKEAKTYRFITKTARNGIYLSHLLENTNDLISWSNETIDNPITDIKFVIHEPSDYKSKIKIVYWGYRKIK